MKLNFTAFATILAVALLSPLYAAENVVLSVNASDAPVGSSTVWNGVGLQQEEVGWLYQVPTGGPASYTITDVGTEFGTTSNQVVTAEIFSNAPSLGGTLLSTGTLTPVANTMEYATLGTPVRDDGGERPISSPFRTSPGLAATSRRCPVRLR